jgi:hypothetical protein
VVGDPVNSVDPDGEQTQVLGPVVVGILDFLGVSAGEIALDTIRGATAAGISSLPDSGGGPDVLAEKWAGMRNPPRQITDDPCPTSHSMAGGRGKNRLPDRGAPNSVANNSAGTSAKKYGPDGWVQKEFNKGHTGDPAKTPKVEQADHVHDWKPNPHHPDGKPERMEPGRPPRPRDLFDLDLLF